MKVVTIVGTRPELIRLSRVIPLLDETCDHVLVHTGQNFDRRLNEIFFEDLGLRAPDHSLDCRGDTPMGQVGAILTRCAEVLESERPDRVLLLGDTNSALSAIAAKRMGIPVYHMEAGNRCYDDRVPEEVNRRIIDHSSDVLLPYTVQSRNNLIREGIPDQRIHVTGNPINEVLTHFRDRIETSNALESLQLCPNQYFLVTLHRSENVDIPERLHSFLEAFRLLYDRYRIPLVCSLHPRTRSRLEQMEEPVEREGVLFVPPLGLFDFVWLEKNARCVLTDSGTVQEECCLFRVPNVTLRDVTERPETIAVGSNILTGSEPAMILNCVKLVLGQPADWTPPPEYVATNVSSTVARILIGHEA